jgi:hypothetical protein
MTNTKRKGGTLASAAPQQDARSSKQAAQFSGKAAGLAKKNIPERLRALPHWLVWRYERSATDKPDAKPRKMPYYVTGQKRSGVLGGDRDTARLATFDDALAAAETGFDGVGLAVLPEQDLTIIDLDDCIDADGVYSDFAVTLKDSGTYVEVSPSGHGLRAVYAGALLDDKKRNFHMDNGERVEVHCGKGFVTFTGRSISQTRKVAPMPDSMRTQLIEGMGGTAESPTASAGDNVNGLASMNAIVLPNFTLEHARRVLNGLPAEYGDREDLWFKVAAAMKMQFGDKGYATFDKWSSKHAGYEPDGNRDRWNKPFGHDRGKQTVTSMRNLVFEASRKGTARISEKTMESWGLGASAKHEPAGEGVLQLRAVSEQEMRAIRWDWKPFIPKGYLTLCAGETSAGKTQVMTAVMAVVTRGQLFYGDDVDAALDRKPGRVLYLGNEDSVAELIRPRLVAARADDTKVLEITGVLRDGKRDFFSLQDDVETVRRTIEQSKLNDAPIGLLIIDPVTAYLGGRVLRKVDLGDNGQLRQILTPWATMAEETGIAIVALTHLAKDTTRNVLHRVLGAQVFTALCRSLLYIVKLPDDGEHAKAMFQVKKNLPGAAPVGGLRFETVLQRVGTDRKTGEPIEATRVEWLGFDAGLTLESLAGGSRGPESQYGPQFRGWLRAYFASHPQDDALPVAQVKEEAMASLGFSPSWWEKYSGQFIQRQNVGGVWYCRPIG